MRLDGGFASPKLFAFFERHDLEYVVAMASNARLEKRAQRLMGKARMLAKATGQTAHLYGEPVIDGRLDREAWSPSTW